MVGRDLRHHPRCPPLRVSVPTRSKAVCHLPAALRSARLPADSAAPQSEPASSVPGDFGILQEQRKLSAIWRAATLPRRDVAAGRPGRGSSARSRRGSTLPRGHGTPDGGPARPTPVPDRPVPSRPGARPPGCPRRPELLGGRVRAVPGEARHPSTATLPSSSCAASWSRSTVVAIRCRPGRPGSHDRWRAVRNALGAGVVSRSSQVGRQRSRCRRAGAGRLLGPIRGSRGPRTGPVGSSPHQGSNLRW